MRSNRKRKKDSGLPTGNALTDKNTGGPLIIGRLKITGIGLSTCLVVTSLRRVVSGHARQEVKTERARDNNARQSRPDATRCLGPALSNGSHQAAEWEETKQRLLNNVQSARIRFNAGQCEKDEYIASVDLFRDALLVGKALN